MTDCEGRKVGVALVIGSSVAHEGQGILEFVTSLWTMLSGDTPAHKGCFCEPLPSGALGWSRLRFPGVVFLMFLAPQTQAAWRVLAGRNRVCLGPSCCLISKCPQGEATL